MNEDKSTRYQRARRRAAAVSLATSVALLTVLAASGASSRLRDLSATIAGHHVVLTTIVYAAAIVILLAVTRLPVSYYAEVTLERRYAFSTSSAWRWWGDWARRTCVGGLLLIATAMSVTVIMRRFPDTWWFATTVGIVTMLVAATWLAPLLLGAYFVTDIPEDRDALVTRLQALMDRAHAPLIRVFEWRLGDRSGRVRATLTGLGRTRRILLSDTLLSEYSDEEIEVVVAHELGHYLNRDLWRTLALHAMLIVLGSLCADIVLTTAGGWFGLAGQDDVAGMPVVILAAGLVWLAGRPLVNASLRAQERRADTFALTMTRNSDAFVSVMTRVGARNLVEERPSFLAQILFGSHPSVAERVAAARLWRELGTAARVPGDW